jgi:hypothetical protein
MKIAAFDIINTADYLDNWLDQENTSGLNENFDKLGFDSMYFMNNMGTMFLGYIVYGILIILFPLLQCIAVKCPRAAAKYEEWRLSLFYNMIVAMIIESYSILTLCVLVSLNFIVFNTYGNIVESAMTLFFSAIIFIFPIYINWFTVKNWELIDDYKEYYSHFFEDLKLEEGPKVLMHNNWFMMRRLLMAVICVFTPKLFFVQFAVFAWSSIINVVIVGQIKVFEDPAKARFEMESEVAIMMILYTIICFSAYVSDVDAKEAMGYVCCLIIGGNFIYNLSGILYNIAKEKIAGCKLWRHRRNLKKQILTNRERFSRRQRLIKVDVDAPMFEEVEIKQNIDAHEMGLDLINQVFGAENQR